MNNFQVLKCNWNTLETFLEHALCSLSIFCLFIYLIKKLHLVYNKVLCEIFTVALQSVISFSGSHLQTLCIWWPFYLYWWIFYKLQWANSILGRVKLKTLFCNNLNKITLIYHKICLLQISKPFNYTVCIISSLITNIA